MYSETTKLFIGNKDNSIDCKTIVLSFNAYPVIILLFINIDFDGL